MSTSISHCQSAADACEGLEELRKRTYQQRSTFSVQSFQPMVVRPCLLRQPLYFEAVIRLPFQKSSVFPLRESESRTVLPCGLLTMVRLVQSPSMLDITCLVISCRQCWDVGLSPRIALGQREQDHAAQKKHCQEGVSGSDEA